MDKSKQLHKVEVLLYILLVLLVVMFVTNLVLINKLSSTEQEAPEPLPQPKVQLFSIAADCEECTDISSVVESIKQTGVEVTEEQSLRAEDAKAKELIEKYSIEKLPTVVVLGEVEGLNLQLTKSDDI